MQTVRGTKYHKVLDIPTNRIRNYEIKHLEFPGTETFELNNYRTMLFGGHGDGELKKVKFDYQTRWHQLLGPTGVWMTDLPIEQYQTDNLTKTLNQGTVLVGGLGLGYVTTILAHKKDIQKIVTVEKSKAVIELVEPHLLKNQPNLRTKIEIIHEDLFKYLRTLPNQQVFDWAFYDIWQSDGEATFFNIVIPLLKLSENRIKNQPICWNLDVMRGQLRLSLESRYYAVGGTFGTTNFTIADLCKKKDVSKWLIWSADFFRWVRDVNPSDESRNRAAAFYAQHYGEPGFKKAWILWLKNLSPKLNEPG